MLMPRVDPNLIGEIPEIHAKRVVGEMVDYLNAVSELYKKRLVDAMIQPIGGNPKSQNRWAARVN